MQAGSIDKMDNLQIEQWNSIAPKIDFTLEPDFPTFMELVSKDATILDYGCGYGRISNKLQDVGYQDIVGYDTSLEMINRGKRSFPNLQLHSYKFPNLPCADDTFDAAICCAVLTCIPCAMDRVKVLRELKRVLKPSGILCICDFAMNQHLEYDDSGVFRTAFGVEIKHFCQEEFLSLLKTFKCGSFSKISSKSISGGDHESFHYIGYNDHS
ncbi:MAG: class I SAM-dependent methyltransferase [Pseudomonadota bacterium]